MPALGAPIRLSLVAFLWAVVPVFVSSQEKQVMVSVLVTIWFLHVAALISPGANVLLVSQLAASAHGRTAMFAAVGVTLGAFAWATLAVLGVHAVFEALPGFRLVLQVAGGVYLLYLASRLWRSQGPELSGRAMALSPLAAFRAGLLTNITNPKSALFFSSVFAASFPAAPGLALQVSAVALIVFNALCWHLLLAWLFSRPGVRSAYGRVRGGANRVAGLVVGALGLGLLTETWREARARM